MPLPKFEDWKAPWEREGKEDEFDAEKARKFIYNLEADKERLTAEKATVASERDTIKSERDALQKAADDKAREGESEVDRIKREKAELEKKLTEKPTADPVEILRLEVALDKGLTRVQAKRLLGSTKEEIEKDADELLESFKPASEPNDDEEDDGAKVRRTPRRQTNPLDPKPDAEPFDIDKAVDLIPRP